MFDDPNVVLHCEKIDKIYPGTKALDQVSFDLLKGKVNVLIPIILLTNRKAWHRRELKSTLPVL